VFFAIGERNIASLAAIRTIIQPIHGEADILLRLAKAAILLARALRFRFVALHANGSHCGGPSTVAGVA